MTIPMLPPWSVWVVLIGINVLAWPIYRRVRKRPGFLPVDRVAAIAALIALDVFAILAAFVMDPTECAGRRTFACLLNENQGLLAFGALLVAATTVYANSRGKQLERRRSAASAHSNAVRQLRCASDELAHNLQHYVASIGGTHPWLPATTRFDEAFELLKLPYRNHFPRQIVERIRTLRRVLEGNRAIIVSLGRVDRRWRLLSALDPWGTLHISSDFMVHFAAAWQLPSAEAPGSAARPSRPDSAAILKSVDFDERVVTHSVRLLMEASYYCPAALTRLLDAPSFRWLKGFHEELRTHGHYTYYHRSSEIDAREAAAIRNRSGRVYCWLKEADIEGVEIVAVRQSFSDLAHIPH